MTSKSKSPLEILQKVEEIQGSRVHVEHPFTIANH